MNATFNPDQQHTIGNSVSISTDNGGNGGSIIIRHGGGDTNPAIPFIIGDATTNGSSGAIVSSFKNSINPTKSILESLKSFSVQAVLKLIVFPFLML